MIAALRVRGPFRGPSGYDHHVREFVRELVRQDVAVQLVDLPEWGAARLPEQARDRWFDQLSQPVDASITLHFTMPHQVISDGHGLDVNYTMFEATRVPATWVEHNRRHALVIAPTESSRQAWLSAGFPADRLRICPLGINADLFGGRVEPLPLRTEIGVPVASYRTRFLNVSELGPRKNVTGLLRAWLIATSADDDALLMLKLGRYAPGWFDLFTHQLQQLQRQVGRSFRKAAPVEFLFDLLSDAEMPRLYETATHYISLSHGEGWDQTMVEAAASGLRLIAPDHSAYRAYLSPDTATLIPSREVPARFDGDPALQALFAVANWWEPDVEAAAAAIRRAIDGQDGDRRGAREQVLTHFTWQRSTRRLLEILSELTVSEAR